MVDLTQTPALKPPPGVTPNFVDPESHAKSLVVVCILFSAISIIFVTVRVSIKYFSARKLDLDDWLALVALSFTTVYAIGIVYSVQYGIGVHQWNVSVADFMMYLKWYWINAILYTMCILTVKLCILTFYVRIFSPVKWFRYACFTVMTIVALYSFAGFFAVIFNCNPIRKSWTITLKTGHCGVNVTKLAWAGAILNTLTDLAIFLLPLPMVWGLHLPVKQKVGVCLVFMTGLFVCVISMVRLHYTIVFSRVKDQSWGIVEAYQWSDLEMQVGLWTACMPAFKPVLRYFLSVVPLRSYASSRKRSHSSGTSKSSRPTNGSSDDSRLTDGHYLELGEAGKQKTFVGTGSKEAGIGYLNGEHHDHDGHDAGITKTVDVDVAYPQSALSSNRGSPPTAMDGRGLPSGRQF
ncbi:MAG: hypothetical protein M1832_004112 [Thelocarpon impressellum]|nr:MAG: hypothetical protein M1832_004112 [Thelocarpon impressellum]